MGVATTTDTTDSVRTSFGRKKLFFLFKKESFKNGQTFNKSRYNFEKKVSEFLKIWQKISRDFSVAVDFSLTTPELEML